VNGQTVVDSKHVLLVIADHRPPTYYFPREDILVSRLRANDRVAHYPILGDTKFWDLLSDGVVAENAAFEHYALPPELSLLRDHLAFKWDVMDHWYEEDEEVFVHARNPYTRIDAIRSTRHVRVEVDGQTVADSRAPVLLFETGLPTRYYLPKEDVQMDRLKPTETHTSCPYKGTASYWSLVVDGKAYPDFVWSYPDPIPEAGKVKGMFCFYNEKSDIYVDGELQPRPQTPWS
jgi:uncharacterized protein (DUF427 family)